MSQIRDDFVQYVKSQLVGPFSGENEVIFDPPNRRYLMGILFPRQIMLSDHFELEGEEPDGNVTALNSDENLYAEDPVSAANDFLPASQGISFFTTATELTVTLKAAEYETITGESVEALLLAEKIQDGGPTEAQDEDPRSKRQRFKRVWKRQPLGEVSVAFSATDSAPKNIWNSKAEIHTKWRSYPHGNLVTVTVLNARTNNDARPERAWDDMLLQTEFEVNVVGKAEILEYPSLSIASHDPEEQELRMQHRNSRVFAIGHGTSPKWIEISGRVQKIVSEAMPSHVVPQIKADEHSSQALDLAWLADKSVATEDLVHELDAFIDPYESWIRTVAKKAEKLDRRYIAASVPVIERLEEVKQRMRNGVQIFVNHPDREKLLTAFRLANEVMLVQMRHGKKDLAGTRHVRSSAPELPQQYPSGAKWRSFQLGFFLLSLQGLSDPKHQDRETVDLIWFPTGGGKTEAYLLVSVFEIFRRRLVEGERGGGTAVLSRYTLSLLTAQQFQRTATTIAACEYIRRREYPLLGTEPISIGLWVGEATTPNNFSKARLAFDELRDASETDDRFLLERCPWCGTEILPREYSEEDSDYGIESTDYSFEFSCTSTKCPFFESLPVSVIDEGLYQAPPTFLLGTVDKFAQLTWIPESGKLFGMGIAKRPPSLIIQDELHLLTGPLGTTMGVYEAAINLLCEVDGYPAKIIASTATIRRASSQVSGLFDRAVCLFPPSGIDADDSYFSRVDFEAPGRLYIGMMAQGHTSDTAVVHTGAALLQAPVDLNLSGAEKDWYWTAVAYHSSLRELGRTVTIARDDIQSRLDGLVVNRKRREYEVDELSSSVPRAQQPRLLERLNLSCEDSNVVDLLATTNMLSVGVDVPRLGLMLMNGQPKSTAEYIQATSRVGRSDAPGLIFGLFRATKPRDRSHYENFYAYHSALYRHVEPTSVTPYSPPSRDRALHAALVILVRHKLGLSLDKQAGEIQHNIPEARRFVDSLLEVVTRVEPRERNGAEIYLNRFVEDWLNRAKQAEREGKNLYYQPNGKGQFNLLKYFNAKGDGWPALGSMRNVDMESLIELVHASPRPGSK